MRRLLNSQKGPTMGERLNLATQSAVRGDVDGFGGGIGEWTFDECNHYCPPVLAE